MRKLEEILDTAKAIYVKSCSSLTSPDAFMQLFLEETVFFRAEDSTQNDSVSRLETSYGYGILKYDCGKWTYLSRQLNDAKKSEGSFLASGQSAGVNPEIGELCDSEIREMNKCVNEFDSKKLFMHAHGLSRLSLWSDLKSRRWAVVDSRGKELVEESHGIRFRAEAVSVSDNNSYRTWARAFRPLERTATSIDSKQISDERIDVLRSAAQNALHLKEYPVKHLGSMKTPIVFDPGVGASLFHELIGHGLESDNLAMPYPYLSKLKKMKLDSGLTIVDNPRYRGLYGSYLFDDDGEKSAETRLVEKGEYAGRLSNYRDRKKWNIAEPGWNGRRENYRFPTLCRESNLVIEPGSAPISDLLSSSQEGLLQVHAITSGEVVMKTGQFTALLSEATFISPGGNRVELTDVLLSGDAFEVLSSFEGASDDLRADNVTCGKNGQSVQVGLVSPTLRFGSLRWVS